MAKLTLLDFGSDYQSKQNLNANNTTLETALENTLSRDGTSPNQMLAALDMNSKRVLNVGAPLANSDGARLQDVISYFGSLATFGGGSFTTPIITATSANILPTNTATVNTTNFVAVMTALGLLGGGQLFFDKPLAYPFNVGTTISNSNIKLFGVAGAKIQVATAGASTFLFKFTGSHVELNSLGFQGPSATNTYVGGENGIWFQGVSSASRNTDISIISCEIWGWGQYGVYGQFIDSAKIFYNRVHDCGYAGITFLSVNYYNVFGNDVTTIGPGVSSNAYGISLTHDSTGYAGGGKAATNPFPWGNCIMYNVISNIGWEGIDTHGVYDCVVAFNRVYATKHGISVPGSSGDALGYAGNTNQVIGNLVDSANRDGTSSGYEFQSYGINLAGAATETQYAVVCSGNIIKSKGIAGNNNTGSITFALSTNTVVCDNIIHNWQGVGILATGSVGIVSGNIFGAVSSTTSAVCILDASPNTTGSLCITNNFHSVLGGSAAPLGFQQQGAATSPRPLVCGNNFKACTSNAFSFQATGYCIGSDATPYIIVTTTNPTVDLGPAAGWDCRVMFSGGGTFTVTNFTAGVEGQTITCANNFGSGTVTVDRSNAALSGGANWAMDDKDTLVLTKLSSLWYQVGGTHNA